ncbi:MAG: hypothetical protein INQ03_25580 [Candidatus Heimdallarchaeota archaeon]|nr:hypothetical protein [Candidatus Heimdallarchaeota archaeon]
MRTSGSTLAKTSNLGNFTSSYIFDSANVMNGYISGNYYMDVRSMVVSWTQVRSDTAVEINDRDNEWGKLITGMKIDQVSFSAYFQYDYGGCDGWEDDWTISVNDLSASLVLYAYTGSSWAEVGTPISLVTNMDDYDNPKADFTMTVFPAGGSFTDDPFNIGTVTYSQFKVRIKFSFTSIYTEHDFLDEDDHEDSFTRDATSATTYSSVGNAWDSWLGPQSFSKGTGAMLASSIQFMAQAGDKYSYLQMKYGANYAYTAFTKGFSAGTTLTSMSTSITSSYYGMYVPVKFTLYDNTGITSSDYRIIYTGTMEIWGSTGSISWTTASKTVTGTSCVPTVTLHYKVDNTSNRIKQVSIQYSYDNGAHWYAVVAPIDYSTTSYVEDSVSHSPIDDVIYRIRAYDVFNGNSYRDLSYGYSCSAPPGPGVVWP